MDDPSRHSNLLTIGAFASAAQLSLKALRLYGQLGLLPPAYTDQESGYRYYATEQLRRAKQIRLLRQIDMPLAAIRRVLEAGSSAQAGSLVRAHWQNQEARVEQGRSTFRRVLRYLDTGEDEETSMKHDVAVHDAPAQLVASIRRKTKIDGLNAHITGSLEALNQFVTAQNGEAVGAPLGIFHGPVNADDDGPVEVCLPVRGKFAPAGDVVTREIAAGKIASVTVSGEDTNFPAILKAYDAAADWITKNGFDMAGSPREVWLDDDSMRIDWPFCEKQ